MKCVTIYQPFATAVFSGMRVASKLTSTTHKGTVGIHASSSLSMMAQLPKLISDKKLPDKFETPMGAIIGVANLVDCFDKDSDELKGYLKVNAEQRYWAFGPFCWILENVRALKKPISWRGEKGLFEVDDKLIQAQL